MTGLPVVRLSERQEAALLALADADGPVGGLALAEAMGGIWRETSPAAAHQGASGLVNKGLAAKGHRDGEQHIRYWPTVDGLRVARELREAGE